MSLSDLIQVLAIIISLTVSTISILQTRKSLKITEDTIKAESRPYISFYVEHSELNPKHRFFIIQNFGKTSARIDNIVFDKELDTLSEKFRFASLKNGTIAPGQRFSSFIHYDYKETVLVTISYSDIDNQKYVESFEVKTSIASNLLWVDEKTIEKSIEKSADKIVKALKK